MNEATYKMIIYKMSINLNVLSVFMKDIIMDKLNDTLIIIIEIYSIGLETLMSNNNHRNQTNLKLVFGSVLYYIFVLNRKTIVYFLLY